MHLFNDLPSSVHTMKVEKVMVKDIVFITRDTTYMELREILLETPNLRSYPFVTDKSTSFLTYGGNIGTVRNHQIGSFCGFFVLSRQRAIFSCSIDDPTWKCGS